MYQILISGSVFGLLLQIIPIVVIIGILYAIYRYTYVKKRNRPWIWRKEILQWIFVCYLAGLLNLVLTPPNFWSCIWAYMYLGYSGSSIGPLFTFDFNFMPTILKWWSGSFVVGDWVKTMLVGNVLLFVPMGFFLPIIFGNITKHKFFRIAIMLPIAIEVVQPMIGRSFDVDDIICNFAGMLIGYGFALMIPCFIHKTAETNSGRTITIS